MESLIRTLFGNGNSVTISELSSINIGTFYGTNVTYLVSVGSVTLGLVNRGANLCFLPTVGGESAIFHQTQRQKSHPWYLRSNMVIGKSVTISNLSQQYPIVLKSEMSCLYTFSGSFLTRFSSEIESDPVGEYPRAATCLESLGIDPSTVTDEDFSSLR